MSGTVCTSASDLVLIIEACGKNNVTKIKVRDILIEFASVNHPHDTKITSCKDTSVTDLLSDSPSENTEIDPSTLASEGFVEQPFVDMTDDQMEGIDFLEYLSIENPAEFEELTIKALIEGKTETQGEN